MTPILTQAIGFVAVAAFILSYQIKSNRWLFLLQIVGLALFCLQFFLLDAFSGCLSLAVNMLRNALMLKYNDWRWVRWRGCPVIIALLFTVILVLTWNGPVSLLAYTASVSSTFVYWTNSPRNIRLVNLTCASPCWLIYDIIVHSWGGLLSEAITIVSILISIFRFGWKGLEHDSVNCVRKCSKTH